MEPTKSPVLMELTFQLAASNAATQRLNRSHLTEEMTRESHRPDTQLASGKAEPRTPCTAQGPQPSQESTEGREAGSEAGPDGKASESSDVLTEKRRARTLETRV